MGMLQNQAEQICDTDAEQDIQKGAKPVIAEAFDKHLRPGCRQQEGKEQRKRQQRINSNIRNDKPAGMEQGGTGR